MKTPVLTLMRIVSVLGLLFGLCTAGSLPAHADGPAPQTPTVDPSLKAAASVPRGFGPTSGWTWYEGAIQYSHITACFSDPPIAEEGTGAWVGFLANYDSTPPHPTVNEVYYVEVVAMAIGNDCAGQYGLFEFGLPPNTSLAISAANPVYCFGGGNPVQPASECPQTLPVDTGYNPGMYVIPSPGSDQTWPLAMGYAWEFHIPVVSSTTLTNKTFQASVWVLDGFDDPWLSPTVPIAVFSSPGTVPAAFNKTTPANAATGRPNSLTLKWAASSGATSYEYCIDTSNNNACNASWVSVGAATSKALSGLGHGVRYYWQVRARNATGVTYANGASTAWWSFVTLPLPGAFNKTAPANAAVNRPTNPVLKWAASANATSYEYCIDTTNNNACNASWISVGTATSKALSGLAHGVHYYWQVRAKDGAGYRYANGASTAWWSFTVK